MNDMTIYYSLLSDQTGVCSWVMAVIVIAVSKRNSSTFWTNLVGDAAPHRYED